MEVVAAAVVAEGVETGKILNQLLLCIEQVQFYSILSSLSVPCTHYIRFVFCKTQKGSM